SLVHMTIRKETPWDYALMTEFMDALQNATFLMDIRFVYAEEPGEEDISELFSNFCFDKYRLMSDISVKYQDGHYVTKKEEGIEAAAQDFNELLAFLSYGLKIEVVDELKEEKPEPKKEEVKAEPQPVEETPEEEDSEEPEEENEEGFAEENENAPEEYDAIAEDMAQHDEELKEAYIHFKENERIQEQLSHNIHSKGNYYRLDSIKELYDNFGGNFEITGYVFGYEMRTTRRGQAMATFGLGDDTSAINVRGLEDKEVLSPAVLGSISNGAHLKVRGAIEIDNRPGPNEGLYQFYLHSFDVLPPKPLRDDPCEEKRVELHAHTKMSAMDGLADASDYVKLAHHMGMKAVAITDHGVIQSFPEAEGACLKINEKITDAEDKFKVLYGVELYAFRNPRYGWNYVDTPLSKGRYCVFDFETTGLSSKYDRITEFGAVLVVDGMVRDRKDFFVNAGMHIPELIQKKTHITDEMIKDGLTEKEAALEIEKFTEGCILVSHNASFDVGFLNAMRLRVGLPKDTHPVIDTLALSHYLFPAAARHNLGSLSRNLKLDVYDEDKAHRADFDAEALNSVWQAIIPILEKNGCNTHKDLKDLVCTDKKMYKHIKAEHVIAIAKNQEGIKALYRLVSHSETKYMTLNSVPKITYDEIEKERENLLLGSACFNGHVFQNAMLKSD
ncbi:MAG: PHP domain-containing protein, partial [Bacilli bacterium]|nr:PHP domain-containing protein [Bacilli bacterium]